MVKQNGIIAGIELADKIFNHLDPTLNFIKNIEDGEALYGMFCAHCHGKNGNGKGSVTFVCSIIVIILLYCLLLKHFQHFGLLSIHLPEPRLFVLIGDKV